MYVSDPVLSRYGDDSTDKNVLVMRLWHEVGRCLSENWLTTRVVTVILYRASN